MNALRNGGSAAVPVRTRQEGLAPQRELFLRQQLPRALAVPVRRFSSFLETSARAYLLQPRCTSTSDPQRTEADEAEPENRTASSSHTGARGKEESHGATDAPPCLQAPADLPPAERPLLSFELYDTACHNFSCRASECLGDSGNKLPPRYFQWVIDGAAYLMLGGLLAVVLAAPATVVERRIDMHIKTLALTSAMYGGIAFWGFESSRFGRLHVPPAGATRYLLGLCSVGLCTLPPILCEVVSPAVGYASLTVPILFHILWASYLKRPPSLFRHGSTASNLKSQGPTPLSPLPNGRPASSCSSPAASTSSSQTCTSSAASSQTRPSSSSAPTVSSRCRSRPPLAVSEASTLRPSEASPPGPLRGGGFLPQWWGATVSHKGLLLFSLCSTALGIYSVRKVEATAGDAILDARDSQPPSRLSAVWAFWRGEEGGREDEDRRDRGDEHVMRRARERLSELAGEKPAETRAPEK
ncbi:conserved hypothetical protein [Neospora caninum Liverpool]|uniref:Transmembrane protein n=1 Tax=Neospora caninum (strain Liverpool) TaxID=572307 RepID=F0VL76_NEOCL|nr:conserved hypothetical protein [Neospora caninum Liverpool]CBZ54828.1 conserved hypothetical protein [Neospora caninum Liverpool]|eukprot:XP_003884856.1 conserved hypothetical protein [Neospora caninum Liverpool]